MQLQEWEIWHTYSSFFDRQFADLPSVGRKLVETGLARAVVVQSGQCYWQHGGKTIEGKLVVDFDRRTRSARISIDSLDDPHRLARRDLNRAGHFQYAETLLHGEEGFLPHPYLRAFLPRCFLYSGQRIVTLNPVVKLFATGVVLVELPEAAPSGSLSVEEFINSHASLFAWPFEHIFVPPALAEHAPAATRTGQLNKMGVADRIRWVSEQRGHAREVETRTERIERYDHEVLIAPLSQSEAHFGRETLSVLARSLMEVVGYLASLPRSAPRFVLRGESELADLAGLWMGRPHIHLLRFSGQRGLASLNENFYASEFKQILARERAAWRYDVLPSDSVPHELFSAYLARESTLWVWSTKGLQASRRWADSYRGHLVYENQIQCEALDYAFMLQNRFADLAAGFGTADQALKSREEAVKLRRHLDLASGYSQVRNLLRDGLEQLGINEIRVVAEEALKVSEARTTLAEHIRLRRIGLLLTAVFGLAAAPAFASAVVEPLWSLSGVPLPRDPRIGKLATVAGAIAALGGLIACAWLVFVNRHMRS